MTSTKIFTGTFLVKALLVLGLAVISLFWFVSQAHAAVETKSGVLITSYGRPAVNMGGGEILNIADVLPAYPISSHTGWHIKLRGDVRDNTVSNIQFIVATEGDGAELYGSYTESEEVGGPVDEPREELDRFEGILIVRSMQPAMNIAPQQLYGAYDEIQLVNTEGATLPFHEKLIELAGEKAVAEGRLDGLILYTHNLWVDGRLIKET